MGNPYGEPCVIVASIGSTSPTKFTCYLYMTILTFNMQAFLFFTPMISGNWTKKETIHRPKQAT